VIALVQDRPGVLARVAGLFRRRGFNIASLVVGKSERPGFSRMTFEVEGDPGIVSHVARQLDKLIDVVEVTDVTDLDIVWREMALVKVRASAETRGEIMQLVEIFRAKIVDVGALAIGIETTGDPDKIDSMIALLQPFGVKEVMRTGRVAMPRAALEEGGKDGFNVKEPESPLWVAQSTDTGSV
jgi:acetolactate synthase-1/3 small subunit